MTGLLVLALVNPFNPIGDLAHAIASAASWAVGVLWDVFNALDPSFGSWFTAGPWRTSIEIGGSVALLMLVVAVIYGAVRGEGPGAIGRTLLALVGAALATTAALFLIEAALQVVNLWSNALIASSASGQPSSNPFSGAAAMLATQGSGVMILAGILMFFTAIVVGLELVVRTVGIYLATMFLPFVFGAMVWQPLRVWAKRLVELVAALVLLKLPLAGLFALGIAMVNSIGSSGPSQTAVNSITLIGTFALGAFVPGAILKVTHIAGEAATAGIGHRAASSAAHRGVAMGASAAMGAGGAEVAAAGLTGRAQRSSGRSGGGSSGMAAVGGAGGASGGGEAAAGTAGGGVGAAGGAAGSAARSAADAVTGGIGGTPGGAGGAGAGAGAGGSGGAARGVGGATSSPFDVQQPPNAPQVKK